MLTSRSAAESLVTSSSADQDLALARHLEARRSCAGVVVLPQPDGPRRVTSCPGSIVNDTSSTAVTAP